MIGLEQKNKELNKTLNDLYHESALAFREIEQQREQLVKQDIQLREKISLIEQHQQHIDEIDSQLLDAKHAKEENTNQDLKFLADELASSNLNPKLAQNEDLTRKVEILTQKLQEKSQKLNQLESKLVENTKVCENLRLKSAIAIYERYFECRSLAN